MQTVLFLEVIWQNTESLFFRYFGFQHVRGCIVDA
jgi:hypothetical protein